MNLLEEYSLIDIWRLRNQTLKQFTRRDRSSLGLVQARLDYWFISTDLQYNTEKTYIIPGYQSDHSILCFQLQLLETQKRGKSLGEIQLRTRSGDIRHLIFAAEKNTINAIECMISMALDITEQKKN